MYPRQIFMAFILFCSINSKLIVIDEDSLKHLMTKVDMLHDKLEANNKGVTLENYYLNSEEVQLLLKVSSRTLYTWRVEGKIRYSNLGNKILYRFEDVKAFVDSRLL
jgi:excisionase family DNA binding protein